MQYVNKTVELQNLEGVNGKGTEPIRHGILAALEESMPYLACFMT